MRYPLIGRIREGRALYRPRKKRYELSKPDAVVSLLREHIPHDLERELFVGVEVLRRHGQQGATLRRVQPDVQLLDHALGQSLGETSAVRPSIRILPGVHGEALRGVRHGCHG